jgi:hypothetical protein
LGLQPYFGRYAPAKAKYCHKTDTAKVS